MLPRSMFTSFRGAGSFVPAFAPLRLLVLSRSLFLCVILLCSSVLADCLLRLGLALAAPSVQSPPPDWVLAGYSGGEVTALVVGGDRVYMAEGPVLSVVDVSDPAAPRLLGRSEPLPAMIDDLALEGDRVYAALYLQGVAVLDVTIPSAPRLLGIFDTPGQALEIDVQNGFTLIADGDRGARIVDMRDPLHMVEVASLPGVNHGSDVAWKGDYALVADSYGPLYIFNAQRPQSPHEVWRYTPQYGAPISLAVDQNLLFLGISFEGIRIFDLSSITSPKEVGHKDTLEPDGLYAAGGYLYAWRSGYNVDILDVTDPEIPVGVSVVDPPGGVFDVAVQGNVMYVADGWDGLRVVDVQNHLAPQDKGWFPVYSYTESVLLDGTTAYVAGAQSGVHVLDVQDPLAPRIVGSLDTDGWAGDVLRDGDVLWVADGNSVRTVDVTDPTHPQLLGSVEGFWGAQALAQKGSAVLVADGKDGLRVVNGQDAKNLTMLTQWDTPGTTYDVVVQGAHAYLADGDNGLLVVDVQTPGLPFQVGRYAAPGVAFQVAVTDTMAYLGVGYSAYPYEGALIPVDVSDPTNPRPLGSLDLPSRASGMAISGEELYVSAGGSLFVYDVSAPGSPGLRQQLSLTNWGKGIARSGDLLAVAGYRTGLVLFANRYAAWTRQVGTGGSRVIAPGRWVALDFPPGCLPEAGTLHITGLAPAQAPSSRMLGIDRHFRLDVTALSDGAPLELVAGMHYTVTVSYDPTKLGPVAEQSLALYSWDGSEWQEEPTSRVDTATHQITATPDHFSVWGVFGEGQRIYLPLTRR